jgi:methyl-accepting chemotaxis protein
MSNVKTFGIAFRLAVGFGFLLLLMIGLTFYSTSEVKTIDNDLATVNDVNSVKQR